MTPTETLRAAADRIERLLDVGDGPHGPWHVSVEPPYFVVRDRVGYGWLYADSDTESRAAVDYAAAMGPLVGAALVAWLRSEQRLADQLSIAGTKQAEVWVPEALAVARAILGEHKESEDAIDIADADAALADPSPRIPHDEIVARYKIDQSEHKEDNGG